MLLLELHLFTVHLVMVVGVMGIITITDHIVRIIMAVVMVADTIITAIMANITANNLGELR